MKRSFRITNVPLTGWSLILVCVLILSASNVWGYRPFVSTDAAVADPKEIEIELGYFNLERMEGKNTFITPEVVLNYGILTNLEGVGEFEVSKPPDEDIQVVDTALSLKYVLKEGILQEKKGISFAVEMSLLLPSTVQGERGFGFEGVGILSGRISHFTFHFNFGGGVDRENRNPFAVWGVIVELPITPKFRLAGEVNGEKIKGKPADNSGLFGFIWKSPWSNIFIDAGVRRGISNGAPDWQFTTGLTFGFSLASSTSK